MIDETVRNLLIDLMAWSLDADSALAALARLQLRVEMLCGFEAVQTLPSDPQSRRNRLIERVEKAIETSRSDAAGA